jgi:hypothetical protein
MIRNFFAWLKSLYSKPAVPADQETKETEMTDQVIDTTTAQTTTAQGDAAAANSATQTATTNAATTSTATAADASTASADASGAAVVTTSPLEEAKAKFNAFVAFVEHGIEVLGKEVEAELVALQDKYL